MEGVSSLMTTIDEVRRFLNPGLTIDGILLTMYDERTHLAQQGLDGEVVRECTIPLLKVEFT